MTVRRTQRRNFKDPAYKHWRKQVLTRDGYQCKWPDCKCKKRLQAHHIKPWSACYSLRFAVSNGITLCYAHHNAIKKKEHHYEQMFRTLLLLD